MNFPYQTKAFDFVRASRLVRKMQLKIAAAFKTGNMTRVAELQRILASSFSARMLAARQVLSSSGAKTPGVDGVVIPCTMEAITDMARRLGDVVSNPSAYVASPVLRIMIPKAIGSTDLRPLGIPTVFDRAVQALYTFCLYPISELRSDSGSFGFRKGMGTWDALKALKSAMVSIPRPVLVLDADIAKFFDSVSHEWLLANVPMNQAILKSILSAGALVDGTVQATVRGFPQGGIISPMLGNFTLDGLQQVVFDAVAKYPAFQAQVRMIRYADDFVVTGPSKLWVFNDYIMPAINSFLAERGLALHPVKTMVVDPYKSGFGFLGMNFAWAVNANNSAKYWLRVTPSTKSMEALKERVRMILLACKSMDGRAHMISQLNLVILGWGNYHLLGNSSLTFAAMDKFIWDAYFRWMKRHFPNGTVESLYKAGFTSVGNTKYVPYGVDDKGKLVTLSRLSSLTMRSFDPNVMKQSAFVEEFNKFREVDTEDMGDSS